MRVLYNFWGHLSDKIGISSPDGNFSYSWSIIQEFRRRSFHVYGPPIDRDREVVDTYGLKAFKSFSQNKRLQAYEDLDFVDLDNLPDIDILLLEWRFPTWYNQSLKDDVNYSPDLEIQNRLLQYYRNKDVMLRILDLDYSLTEENECDLLDLNGYNNVVIFEQGCYPIMKHIERETIYIPFDFDEMLQFNMGQRDFKKHLTYIGNDYNRRDDITNKIIPYSKLFPQKVTFIGKWLEDSQKELREKWNDISFKGRIGANEFYENLNDSIAVPLLATQKYKDNGVMTMRILETLLFGSIPIGFSDFKGIDKWLPDELIVNMEYCTKDIMNKIFYLRNMPFSMRVALRKELVERLEFHDVKNFVNKIIA